MWRPKIGLLYRKQREVPQWLLQQAFQATADQYCLQETFSHDFSICEQVAKAETNMSMV